MNDLTLRSFHQDYTKLEKEELQFLKRKHMRYCLFRKLLKAHTDGYLAFVEFEITTGD